MHIINHISDGHRLLIHIVRGAKYITTFDSPKISKHRALVQKLIQILHTAVYRTVIYQIVSIYCSIVEIL